MWKIYKEQSKGKVNGNFRGVVCLERRVGVGRDEEGGAQRCRAVYDWSSGWGWGHGGTESVKKETHT